MCDTQEHDIYSGLGTEGDEGGQKIRPKAAAGADDDGNNGNVQQQPKDEERVQELSPADFERLMKLKHKREVEEEDRLPPGSAAAATKEKDDAQSSSTAKKAQQKTPEELKKIAESYEGIKVRS